MWGENFISVTSEDNSKYSVVRQKSISFNPARANVGSFGINMSQNNVAVSSAYPVFRVKEKMSSAFLPEYIYLEIKFNPIVQQDIASRAYGTIRQSLSSSEFLKLQIRNLPIKQQKKIVSEANNKFNLYNNLKNELQNFKVENI